MYLVLSQCYAHPYHLLGAKCLLLVIKSLVNERSHDTELGEPLSKLSNAGWTGNEVQEENAVLRDTSLNQGLDSESGRTT